MFKVNNSLIALVPIISVFIIGCGQNYATPVSDSRSYHFKSKKMSARHIAVDKTNNEKYASIKENGTKLVSVSALSTFGADVDTASYTNIKRYINNEKKLPPKDAVRVEEMINYFSYDYKQPLNNKPFSVTTELSKAPWDSSKNLLLIGLQAKKIPLENLPKSNFVALVDVSGSMREDLDLVKKSLKILTKKLRAKDTISILSYAGTVSMVLEPTLGDKKDKISSAINSLKTQGYTNGSAGMQMAYEFAKKHYDEKGNNRVLMFTDGDFNIGTTRTSEVVDIVKEQRKNNIFLSILGYGRGNYNDEMMENVADKGDGNYNYISDILDAKKVFDQELTGTLYTLAKDVKIQVEFNPQVVYSYKLLGYENRKMDAEDFDDDKKDAGEVGSGHSVTALYELTLISDNNTTAKNKLRYQQSKPTLIATNENELGFIKVRYKEPKGEKSSLIQESINKDLSSSNNIKFASSVVAYGLKLKGTQNLKNMSFDKIIQIAKDSKGKDKFENRAEFIKIVEKTQLMKEL